MDTGQHIEQKLKNYREGKGGYIGVNGYWRGVFSFFIFWKLLCIIILQELARFGKRHCRENNSNLPLCFVIVFDIFIAYICALFVYSFPYSPLAPSVIQRSCSASSGDTYRSMKRKTVTASSLSSGVINRCYLPPVCGQFTAQSISQKTV